MGAFTLGIIGDGAVVAPKVCLDGGKDHQKYVAQARHRDQQDCDESRELVAADLAHRRRYGVVVRHRFTRAMRSRSSPSNAHVFSRLAEAQQHVDHYLVA